jgi:hypothetical protein
LGTSFKVIESSYLYAKADKNGKRLDDKTVLDLTKMSSTMQFAQMNQINENQEKYLGKTIKAAGFYYPAYYEQMDTYVHFVVVGDAASCCLQALEFKWLGNHRYPSDYPEQGADLEILGVFKTYQEMGRPVYYLEIDDIVVK